MQLSESIVWMFNLTEYKRLTDSFSNMLFGNHSLIFDRSASDLYRELNLINSAYLDGTGIRVDNSVSVSTSISPESVAVAISTARETVRGIRQYLHDIKANDTCAFYTYDSEMFNGMQQYLGSIETKLTGIYM